MKLFSNCYSAILLLYVLSCFPAMASFQKDSLSNSKNNRTFFNLEKTQKIMMATLAQSTPFYNKDSLLKHFRLFFANPEQVNYPDYIKGMSTQLKKKINILEYDAIKNVFQLEQLTDLHSRFSLVNSANCLINQPEGNFVRVKDIDGRDIMTQPLENKEKYSFIDKFKQGFVRVKQEKNGYGFLNICGDEIVKCQYTHAESFNNGKALVKKDSWFFIDFEGTQSAPLNNVSDAIALTKGISLVRFNTGKYALIDNQFAKTQTPISDIFDSIIPLNAQNFKVQSGSESKIINLEGTESLSSVH
jgi:hypothetical protein